jgi:hypothetical protein
VDVDGEFEGVGHERDGTAMRMADVGDLNQNATDLEWLGGQESAEVEFVDVPCNLGADALQAAWTEVGPKRAGNGQRGIPRRSGENGHGLPSDVAGDVVGANGQHVQAARQRGVEGKVGPGARQATFVQVDPGQTVVVGDPERQGAREVRDPGAAERRRQVDARRNRIDRDVDRGDRPTGRDGDEPGAGRQRDERPVRVGVEDGGHAVDVDRLRRPGESARAPRNGAY